MNRKREGERQRVRVRGVCLYVCAWWGCYTVNGITTVREVKKKTERKELSEKDGKERDRERELSERRQ